MSDPINNAKGSKKSVDGLLSKAAQGLSKNSDAAKESANNSFDAIINNNDGNVSSSSSANSSTSSSVAAISAAVSGAASAVTGAASKVLEGKPAQAVKAAKEKFSPKNPPLSEEEMRRAPKPVRQVRLRLVHIEPWSAIKISFFIGIFWAIANFVVFFLAWNVVNSTGLFASISKQIGSVVNTDDGKNIFDITSYVSLSNVMTFAFICSVLGIIIITLVGALIAVFYNAVVKLTSGFKLSFTNTP